MKLGFFVCLVGLVGLVGCSSVTKSQSTVDYSAMRQIVERMDSMTRVSQREYMLQIGQISQKVDSVKSSEVRDTSRTIYLGQQGDTVRETVIIRERIEREHSSQESTQEWRSELERVTDSLFAFNRTLESKMDSLLHEHEKNTIVEKKAPWYERMLDSVGRPVFCLMAGILIGTVIRKRIVR